MVNLVNKSILPALIITGVLLEGGGWGGLPCPFSKTGNKFPDFGEKCSYCGHLLVKFLI